MKRGEPAARANGRASARPWLILDVRKKMTDIAQFSGKEFAVILVDYCEKKEGDWILVRGVGKVKEGRLFVDRGTETDFPIPEDTYERIQIRVCLFCLALGDAAEREGVPMSQKPNQTPVPTRGIGP
jgi:hypothetical protein